MNDRTISQVPPLSLLALWAGLSLAAGCGGEPAPEPEQAPVTLEVRLQDDSLLRSRAKAATDASAAAPTESTATSYDEVARILIDISIIEGNVPFYTNFELTEVTPNVWRGTVPILPRGRQLRFAARALGPAADIAFSGETVATLTADNTSVQVPLAPAQNDQTFPIPRMFRIVYPAEVVSGQEEQVAFTILGNAGAAINVRISAAGASAPAPEFAPATGTLTLTNTVADFMAVYSPPSVTTDTHYDYQVTISSGTQSAVAVTTNFRVLVKRRPSGDVATGTVTNVRFLPMVRSITANGSATPGAVELAADVSDDSAPSALGYAWSYAPNAGSAPATFDDPTSNPTTFQGYTLAHQGTIDLTVTDGDGGATTLHYTLLPDQFADAIDHGSLSGLRRIVSGRAHTCVITGERKVRCWGDNAFGQLGYGNTTDIGDAGTRLPYVAGDVPLGADPVVQLVAGSDHTCALLESGLVTCWGRNNYGQLGYSRTDNLGDGEPVTAFGYVTLGGLATNITAGGDHTCAVMASGTLRCWGRNDYGQLGRGNTTPLGDNETVYSAGDVNLNIGAATIKGLALGAEHTCVLTSVGAVKCWGRADSGQLGYGNTNAIGDNESLATLVNVALTGPARRLIAGAYHTCAVTTTGALRCWGQGIYGQLGQPATAGTHWGDHPNETPATLPSDVATGGLVSDVAAGASHTCALLVDGQIKCWGDNSRSQLGTGSTSPLNVPPATGVNLGGVTAYQLAAGSEQTCALRVNGTARCWGYGDSGRLGTGSTSNLATPGTGAIQIFAP